MEPVPSAGNAFGTIGSAGKHTVDAKDRNQLYKQKKKMLMSWNARKQKILANFRNYRNEQCS